MGLEIVECVDVPSERRIWPVMRQLREHLDEETFIARISAARREGYRIFAALCDGEPCGAIGFRPVTSLSPGRSIFVDDLIVDEAGRGRGIGKALLDFAINHASNEGCETFWLTSGFAREGAHRFYEAAGMERTGYVFKLDLGSS